MAMNVYAPGSRIGPYEVAGRPLVGGMGVVYVCFDHQEQRPVALKTFKPEYLPDREARDRLPEAIRRIVTERQGLPLQDFQTWHWTCRNEGRRRTLYRVSRAITFHLAEG